METHPADCVLDKSGERRKIEYVFRTLKIIFIQINVKYHRAFLPHLRRSREREVDVVLVLLTLDLDNI